MSDLAAGLLGLGVVLLGVAIFVVIGIVISREIKKIKKKPKSKIQTRVTPSIIPIITPNVPPKEVLKMMRKSYSKLQYQQDMGILRDCINILKTTTNFETFFERLDLGWRTVLTIQQAEQAKVKGVKNTKRLVDSFSGTSEATKVLLIHTAYAKEIESANKLKTEKGRQARMQKFHELLTQYHDELEFVDGYEEILNLLSPQEH